MGREYEPDVFNSKCPAQRALDLVADKWVFLILLALMGGEKRHSVLLKKLPGISKKVLTQSLKSLEESGLVKRREEPGYPRFVAYSLTALGHSFQEPALALSRWAETNAFELAIPENPVSTQA